MVARDQVTLICTDCKHKRRGASADLYRTCCDRCGGQLAIVRYGPRRPRRR